MLGKLNKLLPLFIIAAGVLLYLLFPLTSRKFDIEFDEEKKNSKKKFLDEIAGTSGIEQGKPNIIIITADDLGKTDISLYGGDYVQTPRIDSIGREGVTFTEAYCTSPICSPSRASLLTGRNQQRFGFEFQPRDLYPRNRLEYFMYDKFVDLGDMHITDTEGKTYPTRKAIQRQGMPHAEITLQEILKADGYATALVGKWHLGYTDTFLPNDQGFDYHYGFYEAFSLYAPVDHPDIVNYRHDYFANKYIWKQERKGPCAIRRNSDIVEEDDYLTFRIAEEVNEYIEKNREKPFFIYASFNAPHTPFQAPREYVDRFSHVENENKRVYYAMIAALDDAVGSILDTVTALDLEEETLIFFASDNGGATYTGATENAPLKGGKFTNFEGGINIPAMALWKGVIPEGSEKDDPVSLVDFFTTSLAAAGLPLPADRVYDGVNLLPYLQNKEHGPPHDALFWRSGFNKAVRKGEWKLLLDTHRGFTILYNLESDKTEKRNVAGEHPDIVEMLMGELEEWEKELIPPLWPHLMDHRFFIDGEEYFFAL